MRLLSQRRPGEKPAVDQLEQQVTDQADQADHDDRFNRRLTGAKSGLRSRGFNLMCAGHFHPFVGGQFRKLERPAASVRGGKGRSKSAQAILALPARGGPAFPFCRAFSGGLFERGFRFAPAKPANAQELFAGF